MDEQFLFSLKTRCLSQQEVRDRIVTVGRHQLQQLTNLARNIYDLEDFTNAQKSQDQLYTLTKSKNKARELQSWPTHAYLILFSLTWCMCPPNKCFNTRMILDMGLNQGVRKKTLLEPNPQKVLAYCIAVKFNITIAHHLFEQVYHIAVKLTIAINFLPLIWACW